MFFMSPSGWASSETPANLTPQDQGTVVPVSLFKGHVSNQPSRYILGPGDKLSIKVKDLEKFNQQLTIRPDGYASIQPYGEVYIAGLDVQGLQQWLSEKYKFYLVHPEITVDIDEMRPTLVYISGAVNKPGTYQFLRKTLNDVTYQGGNENVEITLSNVLAKAGGVSEWADIDHIEVVHAVTGQAETFNLRELLAQGEGKDLWLLPGDSIVVPALPQPMDQDTFKLISRSTYYKGKFPVMVLGAVQKQGEVQIDPSNNSLHAALALAGGFIENVSKRNTFLVERPANHGGFNHFVVDGKKVQFALQPGDVVYVSDNKLSQVEHGLRILGSVVQPTYFSGASILTFSKLNKP